MNYRKRIEEFLGEPIEDTLDSFDESCGWKDCCWDRRELNEFLVIVSELLKDFEKNAQTNKPLHD